MLTAVPYVTPHEFWEYRIPLIHLTGTRIICPPRKSRTRRGRLGNRVLTESSAVLTERASWRSLSNVQL